MNHLLQFELTDPRWLWGLGVVPILVYGFWKSRSRFSRGQRLASLSVRSLIVALLVFALAGLTYWTSTRRLCVVFLNDRSRSISTDSRAAADDFIRTATAGRGDNRVAVLPFAKASRPMPASSHSRAHDVLCGSDSPLSLPQGFNGFCATSAASDQVVQKPLNPRHRAGGGANSQGASSAPHSTSALAAADVIDDTETDIAAAIEFALAAVPLEYVPRLVLLSDGNETAGDALRAARAGGAAILCVPLETETAPDLQVSAVHVPVQVAQGEPFDVEVIIDSNHDDEAVLEILCNEIRIHPEREAVPQRITAGENRFRFRQTIDRPARYDVRIASAQRDTRSDNNTATGLVFAAGKPRLLLIESAPHLTQHLARALEAEGILVETRAPDGLPDSPAELQHYAAVALSDVAATDLAPQALDALRAYVSDFGGGLITLGGERAFGLGGYSETVLADVLPVWCEPAKPPDLPCLALVLAIDKSRSMRGLRIELAKDAAKAAVELLRPQDRVGVMLFDGWTHWARELQPCGDVTPLIERLSAVVASGGTNLSVALDEADLALKQTDADLKHVILVTDGRTLTGRYEEMARRAAASRTTVSAIGIGPNPDEVLLQAIVTAGRGRYYSADDPYSIPQLLLDETQTAAESPIEEEPFRPQVVLPTPVLAGIDFATAPPLLGYVVTRPKPTSEVILATEDGDPLLAWWRHGLGMSVAFTSDVKSRWAADWLTWKGFSPFWSQIVRHAMRKDQTGGFTLNVSRRAEQTVLQLDCVDARGRFVNNAATEIEVTAPNAEPRTVLMTQTAPGRYVGDTESPPAGAYQLNIVQARRNGPMLRPSRGLVVGYPDELRLRPTNEALLKSLARVTGGSFNPAPGDIFAPPDATALLAISLRGYLIAAAAVLFVLDVALRRIDLTKVALTLRVRIAERGRDDY